MTPCRIVVVGSSLGYFIRPERTRLDERTYGEVLEEELLARGVAARVANSSRWTMIVPEVNAAVEPLVLGHTPDVVVVNVGLVDAQPRTLPLSWFRWAFARAPSEHVLRRRWRGLAGPALAAYYRRLGPAVARSPLGVPRVPVERFERELVLLLDIIRSERAALVVLLGITPPGANVEAVLPGTSKSVATHDAVLRRLAERPDVDYLDVTALGLDLATVAPDGIHFGPEGHRRLGLALADRVAAWWAEAAERGLRPEL